MKRFVPWIALIVALLIVASLVRQCRSSGSENYQIATVTRGPITQAVTATDFTVRTQQEIAEAAPATSRVMTVLLGAIAGVSLLVGGIGIMNIMLVSVTERTREIGVRMAVGARGNDILTQFLIEAVTLSSVGGVIGIICGIGASSVLSVYAHWPTLISIASIAIAFLFSATVGVFFGFYPARKAAALDPIEALRYE